MCWESDSSRAREEALFALHHLVTNEVITPNALNSDGALFPVAKMAQIRSSPLKLLSCTRFSLPQRKVEELEIPHSHSLIIIISYLYCILISFGTVLWWLYNWDLPGAPFLPAPQPASGQKLRQNANILLRKPYTDRTQRML